MTSEIRRELIDKFTNNERHVFARIKISSFKVQLNKKRQKNIQNQAKFNVSSHDERWRHSKNVLIEKDEFSNELNNRQMTISKELNTSSSNRRVVTNKQRSEDLKNESNDFYIARMSWSKLQFILSKSETFAFATLFNFESKRKRLLIVIEKINENNNKISNEISSQYIAFQDIFCEIKAHKFSKHYFHDHVIEILSNRDSFFDFIYNLSTTKLKILKNYIDEYMKKSFIFEFVLFAKVLILFVKKRNDKLRLCVNYKDLNEIIIKN